MSDFTRRTVVRGAAWTVPVVAVAANAPAFAASQLPPPPFFDFDNAYKNPGNSCTSACIPKQSYGVPVTVTNPSLQDYFIQFTSYSIDSTSVGVFGITTGISGCPKAYTAFSAPACSVTGPALTANNSVRILPGQTLTLYVTSNSFGASPQGGQAIGYRFVRVSDCAVSGSGTATSPVSPPNDAC